mmetsp:Transcript_84667/g.220413  ORF Transcript_84667/g.220413 Transcript_84667/m.220413 type:complete len:316 (-) Transcript_84667:660-1607(-)
MQPSGPSGGTRLRCSRKMLRWSACVRRTRCSPRKRAAPRVKMLSCRRRIDDSSGWYSSRMVSWKKLGGGSRNWRRWCRRRRNRSIFLCSSCRPWRRRTPADKTSSSGHSVMPSRIRRMIGLTPKASSFRRSQTIQRRMARISSRELSHQKTLPRASRQPQRQLVRCRRRAPPQPASVLRPPVGFCPEAWRTSGARARATRRRRGAGYRRRRFRRRVVRSTPRHWIRRRSGSAWLASMSTTSSGACPRRCRTKSSSVLASRDRMWRRRSGRRLAPSSLSQLASNACSATTRSSSSRRLPQRWAAKTIPRYLPFAHL